MKATVVFEENKITVGGQTRTVASLPAHDANWRVVQWDDSKTPPGRAEVFTGDPVWIADSNWFAPYLAAWEAAAPTPETEPAVAAELARILSADAAGTNNNQAQQWFPSDGAFTVFGDTTYLFDGSLFLSHGSTTHTTGLSFGGTATLHAIDYWSELWSSALLGIATTVSRKVSNSIANNVLNATSNAVATSIAVRGIVRINQAGTLIPRFQFSAAPGTPVAIKRNSYFRMNPLGSGLIEKVGAWP